MSLLESMARHGIPVKPAAAPPVSEPKRPDDVVPTAGAAPPAAPAAPQPVPPAAAPEKTREEKAAIVLGFADMVTSQATILYARSQGMPVNPALEEFSHLSGTEQGMLGMVAPAAFPYVENAEASIEKYPKVALGLFAVGLLFAISSRLRVIRAQVAAARPAEEPAPPAEPAPEEQPAAAEPEVLPDPSPQPDPPPPPARPAPQNALTLRLAPGRPAATKSVAVRPAVRPGEVPPRKSLLPPGL